MNLQNINKRIVALVLVVVAILTLFLNFCGLDNMITSMMRMGLNSSYGGVSADDMLDMLGIYSYSNAGPSAYKLANKAVSILKSGGVSVTGLRSVLSLSRKVLKEQGGPSISQLDTGVVLLTIFLILTFISAALALYGGYKRMKSSGIWFATMLFILIIAEGIAVYKINDLAGEGMASSIGGFGSGSISILHLTAWPFIGFAAAVGSVVCMFSDSGSSSWKMDPATSAAFASKFNNAVEAGKRFGAEMGRKAGKAAASAAAGAANLMNSPWTCPTCGAAVEGSARFCSACGTPRPEKTYCPKCGSEVKDGAAFCSKCGNRLSAAGAASQPAQPAAQPYQPAPSQPAATAKHAAQPAPAPRTAAQPFQPGQPFNLGVSAPVKAPGTPVGTVRVSDESMLDPIRLAIEVTREQDGFYQSFQFVLNPKITIGRSPTCDLQIDDNYVSGSHLRIDREEGGIFATDLHSSNGTKLNGAPLTNRVELHPGDQLKVGATKLRVDWKP